MIAAVCRLAITIRRSILLTSKILSELSSVAFCLLGTFVVARDWLQSFTFIGARNDQVRSSSSGVVSICSAIPAGAEEVGIGVGPRGVTVGEGHGDRDRDREHFRDRDRRDRDDTVIIRKDRDHDRDRDRDRRPAVIDRD
jgi:hypothetical protein